MQISVGLFKSEAVYLNLFKFLGRVFKQYETIFRIEKRNQSDFLELKVTKTIFQTENWKQDEFPRFFKTEKEKTIFRVACLWHAVWFWVNQWQFVPSQPTWQLWLAWQNCLAWQTRVARQHSTTTDCVTVSYIYSFTNLCWNLLQPILPHEFLTPKKIRFPDTWNLIGILTYITANCQLLQSVGR